MKENFTISADNLRMATLQTAKETLAHIKLIEEMLIPIYCHIKGEDMQAVTGSLEKIYQDNMEALDNYIKAEYGHLDISNILTSENNQNQTAI